jgi:hypothetical protein
MEELIRIRYSNLRQMSQIIMFDIKLDQTVWQAITGLQI